MKKKNSPLPRDKVLDPPLVPKLGSFFSWAAGLQPLYFNQCYLFMLRRLRRLGNQSSVVLYFAQVLRVLRIDHFSIFGRMMKDATAAGGPRGQ